MRVCSKLSVVACWLAVLAVLAVVGGGALTPVEAKRAGKRKAPKAAEGRVDVGRWLLLGPVAHPLPAFHDAEKDGFDLGKMLETEVLPAKRARPAEGADVEWLDALKLFWSVRSADAAGLVPLETTDPSGETVSAAFVAAYVETDRWLEVELEVLGAHPRRAWLDGKALVQGGVKVPEEGGAPATVKKKVELTPGGHLLLVQTIRDAERDEDWNVGVRFSPVEGTTPPALVASTDPTRNLDILDVTDAPRITSLAIGGTGRRVSLEISAVDSTTGVRETWVEHYRIMRNAAATITTWRGMEARQIDFGPGGVRMSFVTDAKAAPGDAKKNLSSIHILDWRTQEHHLLAEAIENLRGYAWAPDAKSIVYWTADEAKKDERGVKRLEGLLDRQAGHRDKQSLYSVSVLGGAQRRLTAGGLATGFEAFRPDASTLLFTRVVEVFDERPFTRTELWELDLRTHEARKLRDFRWLSFAQFSPDGSKILVAGGAGEFGDAGVGVPERTVPNSYDTQLFVWDPSTGEADPITRDFDPTVTRAVWHRADGNIYLTAQERDRVKLYRYGPEDRSFAEVHTGLDVISRIDVAERRLVAAIVGSSSWSPQDIVVLDLATDAIIPAKNPTAERFRDMRRGTVEPWSFTASNGREIDGRVYLPPGFDPEKKYPGIVYYYGGTSPVDRGFGGRYPKEWWASSGYVVYVLQPSGATGYGQESSATHVNDWGKVTAQEIIDGAQKFLEAHPFVDPQRVGCIGASYGGFMTMLLITQTDLFAAAVSHAGISSLSSYWGEGYWGYSYSAVATADSYPWNRPDIYVEQSPLFHVDRAGAPILLTHGTDDTNVPVGESDAFYTALKLLGQPVEYVQIEGQNHWIMDRDKRVVWSRTIVAWFDRWLKDQPEWWNALYPDK